MKKVIVSLLMIFSAVLVTYNIRAEEPPVQEPGQTDLTIHFKNWDEDYTDLGTWSWGILENDKKEIYDGLDEFGAYFEFEDVPTEGTAGFIAVKWLGGFGSWGSEVKQTGDIEIDFADLVPGVHNHIYILQGANTHTVEGEDEEDDVLHKGYYLADNNAYNLFLVYADSTLQYEDNLGVHAWNGWDISPAWGSPAHVFTNGAAHSAVPQVKVGMLHSDSPTAGLLIYAGGDDNKKTGDVDLINALEATYGEEHVPALGDVGVAYVYNAGDGNTSNTNVHYTLPQFVLEAFSFKFLEMEVADNGERVGTYAINSSQIRVEFNSAVALSKTATHEENVASLISWFEIADAEGTKLAIADIHFNGTAVSSLVIILQDKINNTKDYTISFDLGLEGDENRAASMPLDIDKEGPTFIFLYPSDFGTKDNYEDRVILVEWNKPFDYNLFPMFVVNDDRDGDVTDAFYVPAGEFSKIDTNIVGDYVILLRVEDSWGNVTDEKFIFRVTKNK